MDIKNAILDILQQDAKIDHSVLAHMFGRSVEEIDAIVKELEDDGTIIKYAALVNTEKLPEEAYAEAIIGLKVMPEREYGYDDIARRVYKFPEVTAVYLVSGSYDLHVKVAAKSMKAISQFVWEKIAVLNGVSSTETMFIMKKYKQYGSVLTEDEKEQRLVITP
jgi:DNA-binding Lrp family transcriptional regulator